VPGQARVDHLSAHAHPSVRLRAHVGRPPDQKGVPAPTHRRAVVVAPAPAPTTPRPPSPLVLNLSSQQP
jgi:hypothetical protein